MKRENGFYWVRINTEWRIAEWLNGHWYLCGRSGFFIDGKFIEIDERKIERLI